MKFVPLEAEPLDIGFDALHIFHVFFCGIGVVKAQVASAVIFFFHTEIDAKSLCVSDMQIAVRFGRKTSDDFVHFAFREVFVYDFFDKVS